jgi:membrane fusion protein (multidrug efflux system)
VIGNRAAEAGEFVQPGQRLMAVVPLDAVYVDANFKETQLADLHPGQPVAISVDAYSSRKLQGSVVSVAPASGSVFSLLPPDNATGNFTKIVQRLPVRIAVPAEVAGRACCARHVSHRQRRHQARRFAANKTDGDRRARPSRAAY